MSSDPSSLFERKQKGGFAIKGGFGEGTLVPVSCTVVPFLYPCSGFWYRRSAFFFVPLFWFWGSREHPPKPAKVQIVL